MSRQGGEPEVLHDLYSVVVALGPEPVMVRGLAPAQQRREAETCGRLTDPGRPVVRLPDQSVACGGCSTSS